TLDVCTVLLIPKKAIALIPERLAAVIKRGDLQFLYKEVNCKKCDYYKSQLSVHHKNLRKLQKESLDTEEVRGMIGSVSSSLHYHKKSEHTADMEQVFTIKDIQNVIRIMGADDGNVAITASC